MVRALLILSVHFSEEHLFSFYSASAGRGTMKICRGNYQGFGRRIAYLHKVTGYYCLQNCCERQKRDVSLVEDPLNGKLQMKWFHI